ncbi:ester cyclase [Miniimonas sp. S16]|uniref:ester cyclase n=1 Tax=Miniimonas sp. S16 TaxID=2171623 RepID=UPI00131F203A|nr:nuclear transport factor 2 family protein [Miniimonas sp. S16]
MTTTATTAAQPDRGRTSGPGPVARTVGSVASVAPDQTPDGAAAWGPSAHLLEGERANMAAFALVVPRWNAHDVPGILAHYDDEIVWHDVAAGRRYRGKAEVGAYLERLMAGLPDLTLEVTQRLPRGRFVAEEYVIRGTHAGTLFGLPPTGRRLEIRCLSVVEFRDGKLLEDHFSFDVASVLHQAGLLPPLTVADTALGGAALRLAVGATRAADIARRSFGELLALLGTAHLRRSTHPRQTTPKEHR